MKPETSDDKVLIKPIESDKITKGGIYIPDSAREFERKKTGIVICHGKGYVDQQTGELFPITVWEGCKVSFPAHLGEEFQGRDIGVEDGIYLLINERDIDVIIEINPIDEICKHINHVHEIGKVLNEVIKNLV